jgi:hypothetical protein
MSGLLVIAALINPKACIVCLSDDGLFFVRYAHNFLITHRFSWVAAKSSEISPAITELRIELLMRSCRIAHA